MGALTDRSIVVTGASSGIGTALVRALVAEGARVTMGARRIERLDALARELGAGVVALRTDVRVEDDVVRLIAAARERFGGVDALVNNAGLGRRAPLLEATPTERWREMLETNVLGLLVATREALADMTARGVAGQVVNVASMAAHRVPGPDAGVYAGTKFAVRAITEGLRQELRAKQSPIRVSSVSPGWVDTEFAQVFGGGGAPRPGARQLDAADVARAIVWILSQPPHVEIHDVLVRPTAQKH